MVELLVTATTGGREVGRQLTNERDVINVAGQMLHAALGQYRDDRNALVAPGEVELHIEPHYPAGAATAEVDEQQRLTVAA